MLHRFQGGVRPATRKKATAGLHTALPAVPPAKVILPVTDPLVAVGDHVDVGTRLCDARADAAAVHAGISGVVTAIEPRVQTDGTEALCVVIGNDCLDTPAPPGPRLAAEVRPGDADPSELRAAISRAGLVGMGGAGVPTGQKLENALGRVDALLLNGCECEVGVTADHRLLLERTEDVLTGARLLARALGLTKATIAVAGDKYDAVTALRALLPLRGGDIDIRVLPTRYPQGGERQLVQTLTGRQVPPGGLPADVGCAVFNVHTTAAVTDAVYAGKPLTHRIVTVTGCVRKPRNLLVPLGTPIEDLIREAGGFAEHPERVLAGGVMTGIAQKDLSAPITPGTAAVVALKRKDVKALTKPEVPCIRCGRCLAACPMRLEPLYLRLYAQAGNAPELAKRRIDDCIACGACAYVCPARLPLTGDIRAGKELLAATRQAKGGEGHE